MIMDREGIDCNRQMFGMNRNKVLGSRIVSEREETDEIIRVLNAFLFCFQSFLVEDLLEEFVNHIVLNIFGSISSQFDDIISIRVIRVDGSELESSSSEQNQEILRVTLSNFLLQKASMRSKTEERNKLIIVKLFMDTNTCLSFSVCLSLSLISLRKRAESRQTQERRVET